MRKKGRGHHLYKHGLFSGYNDYRHGDKSLALKKKHQQIYKGDKRKHVIDLVMDGLRDWRSSCFENEAYIRAGLRSALCLKGHSWPDADAEAKALISAALTYLGYCRPPWIEGQPEFVIARENCVACGLDLPEALAVGGRESQFCSIGCAKSYLRYRDSATAREQGNRAYWSATSVITRLGNALKTCQHCNSEFYPLNDDGVFCSKRCFTEARSFLQEKPCKKCGQIFKPRNSNSVYCSHKCSSDEKFITDEIECMACGKAFRAHLRDPNARKKYCSQACAYGHRKQLEIKHTCEFCAGSFVASSQKAKYCCNACCTMDNRMKKGYQPKWMTPTLFDHVFKMAA